MWNNCNAACYICWFKVWPNSAGRWIFHCFIFRCICKFSKSNCWLHHVHLSVYMVQLGSQWMDFRDILYLSIFLTSVKTIQVSLKSDKNVGTLHEGLCTFMIISCWIIHKMRNVSDKCCRENQSTHFMFSDVSLKIVVFMRWYGKIQSSQTGYRWQ